MDQDTSKKRIKKQTLSQNILEYGKLPPQAVDLEEAVLGALMLDKDALTAVIDILKKESFYKETHQHIFEAIQNLFSKSEPIDILTVTNELKRTAKLELVGGPYFIAQLTSRVASSSNIEFHARIISQKHIQRELIRISSDIIKDAYEDTTDVFNLLDQAEQNLFAVSEGNIRREYKEMIPLIQDAIKQIENARGKEGHIGGVPSGFKELDRLTNGWQKSDLIVIAARPGMGKTAFVLSMARKITVEQNIPVAMFSLEMSAIQLVTRLISCESELPAEKLKKGNLEQYEWEQLNTKIKRLEDAPLYIDDTPALSIFELRAKCRRLKAQHKIELIIIDYLQLMSISTDNRSGNREQEISNISRSLKALAKELDVAIIAISQLSRAVETRGGSKRPILSDLRESGAIEQDADIVAFIYRPEYYKLDVLEDGSPANGAAEFIVAKHRNGALRSVNLKFIDRFAKFEDFDFDTFNIVDDVNPNDNFSNEPQTYTIPSKMNDDNEAPF